MNEHQHLLDEARRVCNPTTGEVVELIPEELMRLLRTAKLAVGIAGEASRTATSAKWTVFLNAEIRDHGATRWRERSGSDNVPSGDTWVRQSKPQRPTFSPLQKQSGVPACAVFCGQGNPTRKFTIGPEPGCKRTAIADQTTLVVRGAGHFVIGVRLSSMSKTRASWESWYRLYLPSR